MNSTCSFVPRDFLARSTRRQTLGEGTFGTVTLYDTPDGPRVVKETKLQDKSLGYPPDFLNELDMLIKLKPVKSVVTLHSFCFDNEQKRGYILLEPLECNLGKWARRTPFEERMRQIPNLIATIGGALGVMHYFNLLHNDIKTNNILVDTVDGETIFKLADFGKSYHVTRHDLQYGGIDRYSPPEDRDVFSSELWGFMVCLIEVIIGGHKMISGEDSSSFYSRYTSISSRGKCRFDLPRFLRSRLSNDEIELIPRSFWIFIEPIIRYHQITMAGALARIGMSLNSNVIRNVDRLISKSSPSQYDFRIVEKKFRRKFHDLGMMDRFDRFSKLMNKFLSLSYQSLQTIDLLQYAEVAFIIVGKKKVKNFTYFKDQDSLLLYERSFLMTIGYQIYIL
jgi:serine/threonine protein kinase